MENREKYIFNPALFNRMNKEHYYKFMEAGDKWVLIIPIILPYKLNVPENHIFCTGNNEKIINLIFSTIKITEPFSLGTLGETNSNIDKSKTRVEMILLTQNKMMKDEEVPDEHFYGMLSILNSFILAYVISQHDSSCYRVTPEMLNISSLYTYFNTARWERMYEWVGIYILHKNLPTMENSRFPELCESKLTRIDELTFTILRNENPYLSSQETIHSAKRYLKIGFYREAVVFAQTSTESFIKVTLDLMLIEENAGQDETDRINQLSFIHVVQREMSKYLGGCWDITSTKNAVGYWYTNTYNLRNRIVHAGYSPNITETATAINGANKMGEYIFKRIQANKKRFSGLQKYLK